MAATSVGTLEGPIPALPRTAQAAVPFMADDAEEELLPPAREPTDPVPSETAEPSPTPNEPAPEPEPAPTDPAPAGPSPWPGSEGADQAAVDAQLGSGDV